MSRGAGAKPISASGFVYVAATATGGRKLGLRSARSERALAEALRREKLVLMRTWRLPAGAGSDKPMGLKDQAAFNEQLAQLLSRGVPLVEALSVAETVVSKPSRPKVEAMREQVGAGAGFAACAESTGAFDSVTAAIFRSAERTGDLAGACGQLATSAKRRLEVSGKAATLMIYPAIVMTVSLIVTVIMLTLIVPRVLKSLKDLGVDLPAYSDAMLWLGLFLNANGFWVLMALAGVAGVLLLLRESVAAAGGRLVRALPIVGDVVLAQETARFFSVMAAMTRSGIPLGDALGVSNRAVSHPKLREQLDRLRTRLIEGAVLRSLIDDVTTLPLATRKLLLAAERSGELEHAFDGLAADLADEVEKKSQRLLAALEPLLIVGMFVLIGGLVLSIMVPMINASSQVG